MKQTLAIYGIQDRYQREFPAFVHDHNLCLMQDGLIKQYLHLERLTRRKYDNRMPEYIEEILDQQLHELQEDFDLIFINSFVGSAFISKNGRLRFETNHPDNVLNTSVKSKCWFQHSLWKGRKIEAHCVSHELAHIYSCLPFFGPFKENSLLVHFDGAASYSNFSAFLYRNNKLEVLEYHWDLSEYSKLFNDNALSFAMLEAKPEEHCSVAGKLMGFAAYGQYYEKICSWLKKNDYFRSAWKDKSSFYSQANELFNWKGMLTDTTDPFVQNIAACFQHEFQTAFIKKINSLQDEWKTDYLYATGGCTLNILANTVLVEQKRFKNIFIPPCSNDAGLSIGAAAFLEEQKHKKIHLHSPYLNDIGLRFNAINYDRNTLEEAAKLINEGKIIGVCNGKGEAGPRALGNRSIICRPDSVALAQRVSQQCKGREWYRPVAPVMLEKNAKIVTGKTKIHHLSAYMLLNFSILPQWQSQLQGVTHTNGTARIQTVFKRQTNPFLYDLLTLLDQKYNIIALVNTSFNYRGEPIVQTPAQAQKSALKMNLDALIVNGKLELIRNWELGTAE